MRKFSFYFFVSLVAHALMLCLVWPQYHPPKIIQTELNIFLSKRQLQSQSSPIDPTASKKKMIVPIRPESFKKTVNNEPKKKSPTKLQSESRFNSDTLKTLHDNIQNHTKYPAVAVKMGWEGTVTVEVVIHESGHATSAKIIKSSNYDILDDATLEMVLSWKYRGGEIKEMIQLSFAFQMK